MRSGLLYLYYLIAISVLFSCAPKDDRDLDWNYTGDTSCATNNRPFGGGNGTAENPYTICTRDHLINVGRQRSGHYYKQTRDIDLGGSSNQHPNDLIFAANSKYNGNNFLISGLYINNQLLTECALFITAESNTTFKNVKISGSITCDNKSSLLFANSSSNVLIENVQVSGSINVLPSGQYTGGLIGFANGGTTIKNSKAQNLTITGGSEIGGLVGKLVNAGDTTYSTIITDSQFIGTISSSDDNIGGLVGYWDSPGYITDSSSTGTITGNTSTSYNIGGLVGYLTNNTADTINIATIIELSESYSTSEITGASSVGGIIGYSLFSIDNTAYNNSTHYLLLDNVYSTSTIHSYGNYTGGLVGANIDGITISNSHYSGDLDSTKGYVGGVVGYINSESSVIQITNTYSEGNISQSLHDTVSIGGFIGYWLADGLIENCSSDVALQIQTNSSEIGGFIGNIQSITATLLDVKKSFAIGEINVVSSGGTYLGSDVGGFAGVSTHVDYINVYSQSNITANDSIGGLIGKSSNDTVEFAYYAGEIIDSATNKYGFIKNLNPATITTIVSNSYWLRDDVEYINRNIPTSNPSPSPDIYNDLTDMKKPSTYTGWDIYDAGTNRTGIWEFNGRDLPFFH